MTRDVLERTNQIMSEPILKINSDYVLPVHLAGNQFAQVALAKAPQKRNFHAGRVSAPNGWKDTHPDCSLARQFR